MAEVKIQKSFGSCHMAHVSPAVAEGVPRAMNVHFTLEEALKLHFALGQALAKIGTYNRNTRDGKRAAVNVCLYPHDHYVTVVEGKLRKASASESEDSGEAT